MGNYGIKDTWSEAHHASGRSQGVGFPPARTAISAGPGRFSPYLRYQASAETSGLAAGFWGIADRILAWIGRAVLRILTGRATLSENAAYAIIGGAFISSAFGAAVGYALANVSHDLNSAIATLLGALLGICFGILLGSFVEIVDSSIQSLLSSLTSDSLEESIKSGGAAKHA